MSNQGLSIRIFNSNKFFGHIENDRQFGSKQNVFAYEVIQIPWRMCYIILNSIQRLIHSFDL